MAAEHERRLAEYERQVGELQDADQGPRGRGRRPAPPAAGRAQAGPHPRGAPARDQGPARPGRLPEREALGHAARGARAHRRAPRRGREAHDAAVGATAPSSAPTTTAPSTSSPPAARCASRCTPSSSSTSSQRGQEVVLNESLNVVLARGTEVAGEVVVFKELLEDGTRALDRRPRRRGAGLRARRGADRREAARRRPPARWTAAPGCSLEQLPAARGRRARARRGPRRHLRRRRRPRRPDRA